MLHQALIVIRFTCSYFLFKPPVSSPQWQIIRAKCESFLAIYLWVFDYLILTSFCPWISVFLLLLFSSVCLICFRTVTWILAANDLGPVFWPWLGYPFWAFRTSDLLAWKPVPVLTLLSDYPSGLFCSPLSLLAVASQERHCKAPPQAIEKQSLRTSLPLLGSDLTLPG